MGIINKVLGKTSKIKSKSIEGYYYCNFCNKKHYTNSKIGLRHNPFKTPLYTWV